MPQSTALVVLARGIPADDVSPTQGGRDVESERKRPPDRVPSRTERTTNRLEAQVGSRTPIRVVPKPRVGRAGLPVLPFLSISPASPSAARTPFRECDSIQDRRPLQELHSRGHRVSSKSSCHLAEHPGRLWQRTTRFDRFLTAAQAPCRLPAPPVRPCTRILRGRRARPSTRS